MDQPMDRPMDKAGCWVAYMQVKFTNAFCLRVNRNNYQYQFAGLFWRIVFKVMFQSPRRLSAGLFNDKTSLAKIGINHDFLFFFAEKYFSLDRSFSSEASHADRDVQRNPDPPPTPVTGPPVIGTPITMLLGSGPLCKATLLGPHCCAFVAKPRITESSKNLSIAKKHFFSWN